MPLPTGYGLQVRGPAGEEILVPVCLPAGFELDSLMLCPEFLPKPAARAEQPARIVEKSTPPRPAPDTRPEAAPRVAADAARTSVPQPAPRRAEPTPRMGGTMHYVFGIADSFHAIEGTAPKDALAYGIAIERPEGDRDAEPQRTPAVETHQL
jgi:hypothetical protein